MPAARLSRISPCFMKPAYLGLLSPERLTLNIEVTNRVSLGKVIRDWNNAWRKYVLLYWTTNTLYQTFRRKVFLREDVPQDNHSKNVAACNCPKKIPLLAI